jgi:pimeloyl-ACP methyl ester carboxylesterase
MVDNEAEIVAEEHWAKKGDIELFLFRKRRRDTQPGGRPVLFLVHGSSFSGRTAYDLTVPGRPGYSMMDRFAGCGYDVWTMDHEGYGRSTWSDGNSDIASGVEDLKAALAVVERETGAGSCAFYGQSSGALRAAAFANACPEKVDRLALAAFVWKGTGSPTLAKRRERLAEWQSNHRRPVDAGFFQGMFTRDRPDYHDPEVPDAVAAAELPFGGSVPTGTYLDMGIAGEADLFAFFSALPNKDKQFVFLRGQAHATQLGVNRHRFFHLLEDFLTMPQRRDVEAEVANSA